MKKPTKLLIPTDASEHFCNTLNLPKGHPIFGVYENAIKFLIESLEDDEDNELSTLITHKQLDLKPSLVVLRHLWHQLCCSVD